MAATDIRPVLLVFSAGDCGACVALNNVWEGMLLPALMATKKVRVEKISVPSRASAMPTTITLSTREVVRCPAGLEKFIIHWPTIILIDGSQWNEAIGGKSNIISNVYVFAAVHDANKRTVSAPPSPLNAPTVANLTRFIDDIVPRLSAVKPIPVPIEESKTAPQAEIGNCPTGTVTRHDVPSAITPTCGPHIRIIPATSR